MKTSTVLLFICLALLGCAPRTASVSHSERNTYHQFRNLADALRYEPGLIITGQGINTSIRFMRGPDHDQGPLYILNGMAMGHNYFRINNALTMSSVKSIRVSKSLADRTSGRGSTSGFIEIWTH